MNNGKTFIRHEILNLVTLLNFIILDTNLRSKKKEELLAHLKLIGVLNAEEEFILTGKKEFFNQKIDLDELLNIIQQILESETIKRKAKLVIKETKLIVHGDKNIIRNGLQSLLNYLFEKSKNIQITTDIKLNTLIINYDSKEKLDIKTEDLIQYLKTKPSYSEIFCKIAVEAMRKNGIEVDFEKNNVNLVFPQ